MQATVLGAGVIGGGWAARFVLHGWDVVVYDHDPNTAVHLEKTLARARQPTTPIRTDIRNISLLFIFSLLFFGASRTGVADYGRDSMATRGYPQASYWLV